MNDDIQKIIQFSTYRGLTANEEKILITHLKAISENEACKSIKLMLAHKSLISLKIAKKVIYNKSYVKELFEYGINDSNSQPIKKWLEFVIPKLGLKSAVKLIEKSSNKNNNLLEKAIYWLPTFISEKDIKSKIILENLKNKVSSPIL